MHIHFAPLQGYTDDVYRRIHNELVGGIHCYYTPFMRIEGGGVRAKDLRDIRPEWNQGVNVVPQVIANSRKEFDRLCDIIIENGYKRIDINMGCPFPLQTRHGRGCGLLQHPDIVADIMQRVTELTEQGIQFSVKLRLGLESEEECFSILPLLNSTPLTHVTLHPRIASQQYKGEVHLDAFCRFANECQHPLIYNGDLTTLEDLHRIETEFPHLCGMMIGRGLLARPSLAREYAEGKEWTLEQRIHLITRMHARLHEHYASIIPSETQLLSKLRTFWDFMEPTFGHKTIKKIQKAGNLKNYLVAIP